MRRNRYVLFISVLFFSAIGGFISVQAIRVITLEHLIVILHKENQDLKQRISRHEKFEQRYLEAQSAFDLFQHHKERHEQSKQPNNF